MALFAWASAILAAIGCYYTAYRANRWLFSAVLGVRDPPEGLLFADLLVFPAISFLTLVQTYATVTAADCDTPPFPYLGYASCMILLSYMLFAIAFTAHRAGVLTIVHHAAVISACCISLIYRPAMLYSCLAGMCEVTNVFLNNVFLFREREIPDLAVAANGVLLWLSFIVFRLVLFPATLLMFLRDRGVDAMPLGARWVIASGLTVGFALSIWWFVPITKGMLKKLQELSHRP